MSLSSVLLIHVSSMFLPRNEQEETKEEEHEFYAVLELPKYAPLPEIRKAHRRVSLRLQCDRMMLAWNAPPPAAAAAAAAASSTTTNNNNNNANRSVSLFARTRTNTSSTTTTTTTSTASEQQHIQEHKKAMAALDQKEALVRQAFHILGDKHFRQQYHLLQCRPSRYRMIRGPLSVIQNLTHSRRWFPFLILQSVILAAMVNATTAGLQTQDWVLVLIPSWTYYGVVVLFWMCMLEPPWRRHCTLRSFTAMFSSFAQHACTWLGAFWLARRWDQDVGDNINWYMLSVPFYLAILFRCHCAVSAVASLRDLQAKMVSRERMEEEQQRNTSEETGKEANNNNNDGNKNLPEGFIVVTKDARLLTEHMAKSPLSDNDLHSLSSEKMDQLIVETSPEFRQVDHAAQALQRGTIYLAILGSAFVTLMALKLENVFDVSFWVIFMPVWIYLGSRLYLSSRAPRRVARGSSRSSSGTNNVTSNGIITTSQTRLQTPSPALPTSDTLNAAANVASSSMVTVTALPSKGKKGRKKKVKIDQLKNVTVVENATQSMDTAESHITTVNIEIITTKSLAVGGSTDGDVELALPRDPASSQAPTATSDEKSWPEATLESGEEKKIAQDPVGADAITEEPEQHLQIDIESAIPPQFTVTEQEALAPFAEKREEISATKSATSTETAAKESVEGGGDPDTENQAPEAQDGQPLHEEFERWQSVYENTEVRTLQSPYIPCEIFFQILIACLVVAKLDIDYENPSADDSGFNAFLIILVPFSLGLAVCCCAIAVGCIHLAREEINLRAAEASALASVQTESQNNDSNGAGLGHGDGGLDETPMQAGPGLHQRLGFSAHIDIVRNDFTLQRRSQVFALALNISNTDAEAWLVEHGGEGLTFWQEIIACANDVGCQSVNHDEECYNGLQPRDKEWLLLLRKNLQAFFDKQKFQDELDAIVPLDENDDGKKSPDEELGGSDADTNTSGVECPVCCETYNIMDTVPCEGDPVHFFCRVCFHRYATETIELGGIAGMPCADTNCEATFATPVVRQNLSSWEVLRMEDRETDRNTMVALAAKAVLKCPCGAVGIVAEEEMGDGCITCPGTGCGLQYCALCGNKWHPDTNCPPTKKMLQWITKNTMPCPNCHTPIEKNAGCDHMYCSPPAGCGHHFSYRTGKPMSSSGRNLRGLYHT